jgi:hypothetical protein
MLYNRIAARNWRAALFDAGGAAGLMLYVGGVAGFYFAFAGAPDQTLFVEFAGGMAATVS